jgi:hypothetical protein
MLVPQSIVSEERAGQGLRAMKSPVNLELIFPIKDAPSATFMSCKASCLLDAGIITEGEKQWVDARVLSVLAGDPAIPPVL